MIPTNPIMPTVLPVGNFDSLSARHFESEPRTIDNTVDPLRCDSTARVSFVLYSGRDAPIVAGPLVRSTHKSFEARSFIIIILFFLLLFYFMFFWLFPCSDTITWNMLLALRVRIKINNNNNNSTAGIGNRHSGVGVGYCRRGKLSRYNVPARHISEGAAPCPYRLAPCPIDKRPARIIIFYIQQKM